MKSTPPQNRSSESSNQLGMELADRGWLEEALREFGRAIDMDKKAPFPRINRASVYLEQGRMLEALEDLLSAVRLAPQDPATHYHLGLFLTRFGVELGQRELQTTLIHEPDQIEALLQLGAIHADRGEFTEANRILDAALDVDPNDHLANREKGVLLLEQGQVHAAISFLKKAHDINPGDIEIEVDLGLAFIQAGFFEKGKHVLLTVIEKKPDHLYALYNLAAIEAERGSKEKTLSFLLMAARCDRSKVMDWLNDDPMFVALKSDKLMADLENLFHDHTLNPSV
jgi:tetratricopeptide (TPR) repeat protein